jgi:NADP-dependent 3-hydroxy acid dehydrogenase YdfG
MTVRNCAIITGASSGIGAATVRAMADSGFDVIACARRVDRLESLAKENSAITAHHLDITDQKSVEQLVLDCVDRKVSILINCAGGAFDASSVLDSDPEIWRKTYDLNVVGTVRMVKAFAPLMQDYGHIVIISSTAGHVAYENGGSYVAAKHGETSLARTLRLELNGLPIRITEIAPGMVKTEEFSTVRFSGDIARAAKVYEGVEEPLTAEDVAEAIRWSVMLPQHFNVDSMVIRPVAQASNHKVHRTT